MRACVYALAVTALVAGIATDREPEVAVAAQGVAELQIDAASLSSGAVSRVEVESDGQLQDLARNPNTGTFDGTLVLGAGSHAWSRAHSRCPASSSRRSRRWARASR
jgi:hypothetical protein